MSRNSALKVIDHALSGKEGIANSEKFVEILGFRTLFPLFMKEKRAIRFFFLRDRIFPGIQFSRF